MDLWLFSGTKLRTKFDTIFVNQKKWKKKYEYFCLVVTKNVPDHALMAGIPAKGIC